MGLVSAIFWVLFGACFIWYQFLKEDAETTISITLAGICIIAGIVGFAFTFHWILSFSIPLAAIFLVISLSAAVYYAIKWKLDRDVSMRDFVWDHNRVMRVLDAETYTDEELNIYAKNVCSQKPWGALYSLYGLGMCRDKVEHDYRMEVRYKQISNTIADQEQRIAEAVNKNSSIQQ